MSQNRGSIWKEVILGFGPVTSYVSPFVVNHRRLSHNGWPCQKPFRYNRKSVLVKMQVNFSSIYNKLKYLQEGKPEQFIYLFSMKGSEQFCSVVLTFSYTVLSAKGNCVSCQLLQSTISLLFLVVNTWLFCKALLGILLFQLGHKDPHLPLSTYFQAEID